MTVMVMMMVTEAIMMITIIKMMAMVMKMVMKATVIIAMIKMMVMMMKMMVTTASQDTTLQLKQQFQRMENITALLELIRWYIVGFVPGFLPFLI